ncbi:flagellar hook-basal body protein [Neobacillus massiliamazoniensis]|uniref:Flagellar hook-basal body protein n=1 Tax=Neobacillus massiliamazoniensis TaxID=1499688 RepID=A0A0U1NSB2_9BACI|nr:flagellar hook-basal body protein [Neobacillus massiliamazoniensis]CRK80930.1 flagellar hook-basal body protein [Neobacillus massiliamazoniensis]
MLRGLDSAASGMFSLERRQEALADNLANVQTAGYKKDDTTLRSFPKLLIQRIQDFNQNNVIPVAGAPSIPGFPVPIGELYNGVYAQERVPNFSQVPIVETDQPLDIAINDQGISSQNINGHQVKPAAFFAVQLPDGTVGYTRNGKFDLDASGHLVTADGYQVLGADHKPVQITDSISKADLQINQNGQIISYPNDPTKTKMVGQIGIAVAPNPNDLTRMGKNVYQSPNPLSFIQDPGSTDPGVSLQQGFTEQSNVDPGQTMSDMMMTVRGYEANQKVIGAYDQSLEQLYSVGKLNG